MVVVVVSAVRKDVGPSLDAPAAALSLFNVMDGVMTGLMDLSGSLGFDCKPSVPGAGPIFLNAGPDDLFSAA